MPHGTLHVVPVAGLPFAGLSIVPEAGVAVTGQNQARYNAGRVNAIDTPQIAKTFTLKNSSKAPVTIGQLQPACTCTTASLVTKSTGSTTLAPGQQVQVQMAVTLSHLPAGALNKSVAVYLLGHSAPAVQLQIAGTLAPSASFTPTLLDFGHVPAGQARTLKLTVSVDRRMAPDGKLPELVSSDPAIHITEEPGNAAQASGDITRTYRVSVPADAPVGMLYAVLSFAPAAGGTQSAVLASARALLVGQVTGDISAEPSVVSFGAVAPGQAATRQIVLMEMHPGALADAQLKSAGSWFSAKLQAPAENSGGVTASEQSYGVLAVALSPQAPEGILSSQIKLTLKNGEEVVIPVNAYVRKAD